ncbi:TetR/AcrR family transcriptional regulator [Nocardia aurantia]|nr:TetR/AcrR family transcriptional regulator [Nocardia aurantia]
MSSTSPDSSSSPDRPVSRKEQREATRRLLLRTAERLFAERGLSQVSMRQLVEAAGQGNNSAVKYHVGTRDDLIREIIRTHIEPILRRTEERVTQVRDSDDPRDHVASLVLPYTEHLAGLGAPSWFARFNAQVAVDPAFGEELRSLGFPRIPIYQEGAAAFWRGSPDLPPAEFALRRQAMRTVVIHTCADHERLAATAGEPGDWDMVGEALTDAITGLLVAPRRPPKPAPRKHHR